MKAFIAVPAAVIFACLTILACDSDGDNSSFCNVTDPVKELPWLRDTVAELKTSGEDVTVRMGEYQHQKVFMFSICCITCSRFNYLAPTLYNCMGKEIENADLNKFTYQETIYRKDDSDCS
jgi:hypothetical protein